VLAGKKRRGAGKTLLFETGRRIDRGSNNFKLKDAKKGEEGEGKGAGHARVIGDQA